MLFDIDGTLLHGRPEGHTRAMVDAMREAIRVSDGDRDRARDLFLASGFTKSDWDHYQPKVSRPEMVAGRVRLVPSA